MKTVLPTRSLVPSAAGRATRVRPTLKSIPGALVAALMTVLVLRVAPVLAAHEVTVYSYVTPAGRNIPIPTAEQKSHCLLVSGGYHEIGPSAAGERPANPALVDAMVRHAAHIRSYEPLHSRETADIVLAYQWGLMSRDSVGTTGPFGSGKIVNFDQMVELVGGRALPGAGVLERNAIFDAAAEERYYLIVSAFDYRDYTENKSWTLLWRAQMSVPTSGLTQDQAIPELAAAGSALFGRETPLPRLITVKVTDALRIEAKR